MTFINYSASAILFLIELCIISMDFFFLPKRARRIVAIECTFWILQASYAGVSKTYDLYGSFVLFLFLRELVFSRYRFFKLTENQTILIRELAFTKAKHFFQKKQEN